MKKPYFTKWQKIGLVVLVLCLLAYKGILDWPRQILLPDGYGEKWPTYDTEGIIRDHGPITDAWNCKDRAPSLSNSSRSVLTPVAEYPVPRETETFTATLAPDGETVALISSEPNKDSRLVVRPLTGDKTGTRFSLPTHRFIPGSAKWSSDSKTLWITASPKYGGENGPVVGFRISNGKLTTLGRLNPEAGRMKSFVFADGALAFGLLDTGGAKGGMHLIMDTNDGAIRDLYPEWKGPSVEYSGSFFRSAPSPSRPADDAIVGSDGRVQVFSRVGEWFTWTQGRTPKMLANPFPDRELAFSRLFANQDETRILYMRPLSPTYQCLGDHGVNCATGPAVDSILLSSHDFDTGKAQWAIRSCVPYPIKNYPFPAVTPDGRYALVGLPTLVSRTTAQIGVVDLTEGKIVQRLPAPGEEYSFGFSKAGAIAWTYADGKVTTYSVAQ